MICSSNSTHKSAAARIAFLQAIFSRVALHQSRAVRRRETLGFLGSGSRSPELLKVGLHFWETRPTFGGCCALSNAEKSDDPSQSPHSTDATCIWACAHREGSQKQMCLRGPGKLLFWKRRAPKGTHGEHENSARVISVPAPWYTDGGLKLDMCFKANKIKAKLPGCFLLPC